MQEQDIINNLIIKTNVKPEQNKMFRKTANEAVRNVEQTKEKPKPPFSSAQTVKKDVFIINKNKKTVNKPIFKK